MKNIKTSFIGMGLTSLIWTYGISHVINALEVIGPFTLISIRFFIAFIALTIFHKIYKTSEKINKKDNCRLIINGLIGSIVYYSFSNFTIIYLSAVDSATLSSMQLIFMLWAESMFLGSIVTPKKAFYVVVATVGGILLMKGIVLSLISINSYILMLIATCFWVAYHIIQLPLLDKYKTTTIIKYQSFYSFLASVPFIFLENNTFNLMNWTHIASLIYLGLFGIAIGYSFNSYALKNIGPTNTSFLLLLQPVIILFTDFVKLGKIFTLSDYFGFLFIFIGMVLMILDIRNKKEEKPIKGAIV
jgi:drug/metabolite transporter (DMT)-like permease